MHLQYEMNNESLVERIRNEQFYLKFKSPRDERVLTAMSKVDRGKFLLDQFLAYEDNPVSIGYEQNCSEPSMVAFMDDILELQPGMNVLEIGTGCGYHATVTSHLIGRNGHLVTIECIESLAALAKRNLATHFGQELSSRITILNGDGSSGYKKKAPYDRIYLTAGVECGSFNSDILANQLNPKRGILLFPEVEGALFKQTYYNRIKINEQSFDEVIFVPLKGKNS